LFINSSENSRQPKTGEFSSSFGLKIVGLFELLITLISFLCLIIIINFWLNAPASGGESSLQRQFFNNLDLLNFIGFFVVTVAFIMTLSSASVESIGSGLGIYFIFFLLLCLGLLGLVGGLGLLLKKTWAFEVSLIFSLYFSLLGLAWISFIGIVVFFIVYKHRPENLKSINWIKDRIKAIEVDFSKNVEQYWLGRGIDLVQVQEYYGLDANRE